MKQLKAKAKAWAVGIGVFLILSLIQDEIAGYIVLLAVLGLGFGVIFREAEKRWKD